MVYALYQCSQNIFHSSCITGKGNYVRQFFTEFPPPPVIYNKYAGKSIYPIHGGGQNDLGFRTL